LADHRVIETWRGEQIETLEDLLRPGLRAVCVGINPSPVSVAAGHYYQGRLGKLFFARLQRAGLIPPAEPGGEDDAAFACGIGFTDLVKRPSARAHDLGNDEFAAGRSELERKLARYRPELIIFTFKKTATVLCGAFPGHGFVDGVEVAEIPGFVMPGPYAKTSVAEAALSQLRQRMGSGQSRTSDLADS
jgi:TDG/mug DNA glycosylase family protein